MLAFAAIGPLLVVLVYSFLTPGEYGNVEWKFSRDGWIAILFQRDIFDGTLQLADAHLTIFWRSIWLSLVTTILTFARRLSDRLVHRHPARAGTRALAVPDHHPVLDQPSDPHLRDQRGDPQRRAAQHRADRAGLISEPIQMLYTDAAVLIGMAYVYLPLMVLPLYAAIDRFDMRLLEAAYDLYASRWQVLRRVILPIVKPRHRRGVDPGLRALAWGLCHAARAGRRQEHDDRQLHRAAVRPGPQLAAWARRCR